MGCLRGRRSRCSRWPDWCGWRLEARGSQAAQRPPGLVQASKPRIVRWIAICAIVMFVLQAYIAGAVESWTVAGAFGQRRFVSLTPLLVLGLASLLEPPRFRRVMMVLVVMCVWWNLGLMAQFGTQHHGPPAPDLEGERLAHVRPVAARRAWPRLAVSDRPQRLLRPSPQ